MPDSWMEPAVWLLLAAGAAAPVTIAAGAWKTRLTAPVALFMTFLAFAAALWGWRSGSESIDLAWAPAWGLRFSFALDGPAVLYALLATGVGFAVVLYAGDYMPLHLHHEERPSGDIVPFFGWLLLFMGAMVGLVMARDLILIFVFWDITAIASFFLIGYDKQHREARSAALMAFLTTVVSALALLVAVFLIQRETGSFALDAAFDAMPAGRTATVAGVLIAIAGFAKSAQTPFHFWLPRAMAAPTPVSAYLHSAAMVAAGVFLLSRFHPILALSEGVLNLLVVVGFASMAVGGVIAVTRERLKQLLAYSTISQYGYVVVLLGIGTEQAATAACFYVIAHAIAKSALFLTAGAVTEATGTTQLPELGGLARRMPLLAIGSGLAAASLAAIPGTLGFFKDELFFATAADRAGVVPYLAVAGAALTVVYAGKFWIGIFLGREGKAAKPVPAFLVWPIVVLGVLSVVGGWWFDPFLNLADAAGSAFSSPNFQADIGYHPHLGYTLEATEENLMAIAAIGLGALLLATRRWWELLVSRLVWIGDVIGPERWFIGGLQGLNRLSTAAYRVEVRDFRSRIASILPPAALLIGLGLAFSSDSLDVRVGGFASSDLPLTLMIGVAALAALVATSRRDHLTLSLVLSGVGFSMAVVYALLGAPDVALVAVLVETLFTLLFLGMVSLIPSDVDPSSVQYLSNARMPPPESHRLRDILIAAIGGILAFVVAWTTLTPVPSGDVVANDYINLTESAHGKDIVTVILADFRGFDTMGEITVIGIAFLGMATLLRRWRSMS